MCVSDPALSQAFLPSLAKAGTNEVDHQAAIATAVRQRTSVRARTLAERQRLYLLARLIVKRHYDQPLTVRTVAKTLATSPRQLQRAYAQAGKATFHKDLTDRRLRASLRLLCEPAMSIGDIARQVGYPQRSQFIKTFRRHYGITPRQARKRLLTKTPASRRK